MRPDDPREAGRYSKVVVEEPAPLESVRPKAATPAQHRLVLEGASYRVVFPLAGLAAIVGFCYPFVSSFVDLVQSMRAAVALVATFQKQADDLKAQNSKLELELAKLRDAERDDADWTGAVFSQALGVRVRRDDSKPLPALDVTFAQKKGVRVDPSSPNATVETPIPTGK